MVRRLLFFGLVACCALCCGTAVAQGICVTCQAGQDAQTTVRTVEKEGETYLFLPAAVSPAKLTLQADAEGALTATGLTGRTVAFASGEAWDLTALYPTEPEDGVYRVTLTAQNGASQALNLLFSANVRALFLVSDDPVNAGRAWLDDTLKPENCATGSITLLRADGSEAYRGKLSEIRGRGNSTWGNFPVDSVTTVLVDKKPYQIKLAEKADLLDTGDAAEANRRWVLLADYFDGTLLHNRISLDLARELGETEASQCQPVDLYYDGEYRGLYLLAEKVEVATGRVEVEDYDNLLEKMSKYAGISLDKLTQVQTTDEAGMALSATEGVPDAGATNLGGYLIELDKGYFSTEKAYFTLTNGMVFVLKNPQYASEAMVQTVSALFTELQATLANYGTHPQTGKQWSDYLDTDTLLPLFWVNELAKNPDVWRYSSTYFVLPEGGGKLRVGPVWDFDLAYSLRNEAGRADATALTDRERNWGYQLCCIPAFQTLANQFFEDRLAPVVNDILLGDENAQGTYLHSLTWYWEQESASRRMNNVLWDPVSVYGILTADTYEENYQQLRAFLTQRMAWLTQEVQTWPQEAQPENVALTLTAPYANVEGLLSITADDLHTNVTLPTMEQTLVSEATEEAFAVWRADITLAPKPGFAIPEDAAVTVNGTAVPFTLAADGSITLSVLFDDPSYRPADYEGTDYGLVFNADYVAAEYPEVAAEAGEDPAALLQWYVDEGLSEGLMGNAFFDPREALANLDEVEEMFGDSYGDVAFFFMEAGYEDWMTRLGKTFEPTVRPAGE